MTKKTEFESLDSSIFEPISLSLLRQIRGGDSTTSSMPTYNPACSCATSDTTTREDNKKKKPTKV